MGTDPVDLVARLSTVRGRLACSDAERRAARLMARELRARGRTARTDTFWVRPAGGAVHGLLAALGVAASVLSVQQPRVAMALLIVALVLLADDLYGEVALLRRLMAARATQNVVANGSGRGGVRLIVTAPLDAPREALLGTGAVARAEARARRALRGHFPGVHGFVVFALLALLALAALRADGASGVAIGLVQMLPTAILLLAAAAFAETAVADAAPGANAHASAVAVAVALVQRLDASPPKHLAVDLLLAGAGEPEALGVRRELRARRRAGTRREDVAVLQIAPCGGGTPVWWTREGRLFPVPYHFELVGLCREVAAAEAHLNVRPHETRRTSGARAARGMRWPAVAVGCVDADGVAPHAGEEDDLPDAVDAASMDAALEFSLALVHRLDAFLATKTPPAGTDARAVPAQRPGLGTGVSPE